MSREYEVRVVLRNTDPKSTERKISANFTLSEELVNLANVDLLWEAFRGTVAAIQDADVNGVPEGDPVVNI